MIFKYNEFINEKLSDKLSGFTKEDFLNKLLSGEINISKFFNIYSKYKLDIDYDELKPYFLNDKIDFNEFYNKMRDAQLPPENYLKELFLKGKININIYSFICIKNHFNYPNNNEIFIAISNYKPFYMIKYAIEYKNLDLVKLAIEKGVDIHYNNDYYLYLTITYNCFEIFEYLLKAGVKIVDKKEMFLTAVNSKTKKIIDYLFNLIKNDINFNELLQLSIEMDFYESTKFTLEHGAIVTYDMITKCNNVFIKELLQKYYDKQNG